MAALIYLAVSGQPCSRAKLAEVLWDELDSREDLRKGRTVLPRLRGELDPYLVITRDTIAFDPGSDSWLDVAIFCNQLAMPHTTLSPEALASVLALYQGDFLGGFTIRSAPSFEQWVCQQREELHQLAVRGYHRLADAWLKQERYEDALNASKRLLLLEPWHEEGHRQQMRIFALRGERVAALTQFGVCQRVLAEEFGLEPTTETTTLYEDIRSGTFDKPINTLYAPVHSQAPMSSQEEARELVLVSHQLIPANTQMSAPARQPQINWGAIPRLTRFYGRDEELVRLSRWLFREGCHLIGVFGVGGQGKTELVGQLLHTVFADVSQPLAEQPAILQSDPASAIRFRHIIWRSLLNVSGFAAFVRDIFIELGRPLPAIWPEQTELLLGHLIESLTRSACLLILDNSDAILPQAATGAHQEEAWPRFWRWAANHQHESCVLLIGREQPAELSRLEEYSPLVRSLHLAGLDQKASLQLLAGYGLTTPLAACEDLIACYGGHPLALWGAAETVHEMFAGKLEQFLCLQTYIFAELHEVIDQQIARLTFAERQILDWLAIECTPLSFAQIWQKVVGAPNQRLYIDAYRSLSRRFLFEPYQNGVGLPAVVAEFLRNNLVETMACEVLQLAGDGLPSHATLNRYPLVVPFLPPSLTAATRRDRQSLLCALLEQLKPVLGNAGYAADLQHVIEKFKGQAQRSSGYAIANLTLLLDHWRAISPEAKPSPVLLEKNAHFFIPIEQNLPENFPKTYQ